MLEHFSEKLNLSPQGIWEPSAKLEAISYPLKRSHNTKIGQQEHKPLHGITKKLIENLSTYELNKIKNNKPIKFGSRIIVVAKPALSSKPIYS